MSKKYDEFKKMVEKDIYSNSIFPSYMDLCNPYDRS